MLDLSHFLVGFLKLIAPLKVPLIFTRYTRVLYPTQAGWSKDSRDWHLVFGMHTELPPDGSCLLLLFFLFLCSLTNATHSQISLILSVNGTLPLSPLQTFYFSLLYFLLLKVCIFWRPKVPNTVYLFQIVTRCSMLYDLHGGITNLLFSF